MPAPVYTSKPAERRTVPSWQVGTGVSGRSPQEAGRHTRPARSRPARPPAHPGEARPGDARRPPAGRSHSSAPDASQAGAQPPPRVGAAFQAPESPRRTKAREGPGRDILREAAAPSRQDSGREKSDLRRAGEAAAAAERAGERTRRTGRRLGLRGRPRRQEAQAGGRRVPLAGAARGARRPRPRSPPAGSRGSAGRDRRLLAAAALAASRSPGPQASRPFQLLRPRAGRGVRRLACALGAFPGRVRGGRPGGRRGRLSGAGPRARRAPLCALTLLTWPVAPKQSQRSQSSTKVSLSIFFSFKGEKIVTERGKEEGRKGPLASGELPAAPAVWGWPRSRPLEPP